MIDAGDLFIRESAPEGGAKGAFLLLHGMESHSGWWVDCSARLVRNGWAVIAFDRAGWGKSPGRRGHMASYRDFVETVAALATEARRQYGSVHLAGQSWGGMGALYLALRRGWLFDSVSLIAPGIVAQRDLSLRGKFAVARAFLSGDGGAAVSPSFRIEHFTRDPQWQDYIHGDPRRVTEVSASFCVETLKMRRFIKENAGRRRIPPALCLLGGDDEIIDNPATGLLCRKAGGLVEIIPRAAHTLVFEAPAQTAGILDYHAEEAGKAAADGAHARPVWVVGAGAVGGAVAALLAVGGVRTGVLAKPSQCELLRRNGLTLRCGAAERTAGAAEGLSFAGAAAELPAAPRLVILAVKSFDTQGALEQLSGQIPEDACILSLQNGVGNEMAIHNAFPRHTVIAGAICAGLELIAPGCIQWGDDRGGLAGGVFTGSAERARAVWDAVLPRTGMECRWITGPDAAARVKWSKLMLNIGFNALNALTGLPPARILADPRNGGLAVRALAEGFAVMRGMKVQTVDLPGFPVSKLRHLLRLPAGLVRRIMARGARGAVGGTAFSMRQDILQKRQHTEIQELNGRIVACARRLGIPAPANEELTKLLEKIPGAS